jgi:hypothetical protein
MIKLTDLLKEVTEQKYTIYCDMDGVLVDFDKGYEDLTGMTPKEADTKGPKFFWEPISKAGEKYWVDLKWMSDGKQLWNYIKKHNPSLLSAPSREKSSRTGKQKWVDNNLPNIELILRPASQKQELSGKNKILIDDKDKNIEQWESKGGLGILHTSAADTIKQLKELGL